MAYMRPMPTTGQAPEGKGRNPRPMPTIQPAPPGKDPRNPVGNRERGPSLRLPMPTSGESVEMTDSPSNLRELIMMQAPAGKEDVFADFRRRQMLSDQDPMLDAMMRRMR